MLLRDQFGDIDIYLFDQLLRGRLRRDMRLLDAGCGNGRNIRYMLREGFDISAVDIDENAVGQVRRMAAELAPDLPGENFRVGSLEQLSFPDKSFDAVISSAVLHFAADETQFMSMLREMWRVLKPGGIFFARLASSIGIEERIVPVHGRRFHLPDGTTRFLVDEKMLLDITESLGGRLIDPIKTVNVQNQRCMTTWVMGREG
jgi:SAM-dependent methyltransferase